VRTTATLAHSDRFISRRRATPASDVDLAIENLASMMAAETDGDVHSALEAVARAARRLIRTYRHNATPDVDAPVAIAGSWTLDNGIPPNVVLGED
jgi:hypothetical protein